MSKSTGLHYVLPILAGRLTRFVTRLRGGGSAMPGVVVQKLAPNVMRDVASQLPYGVVFVLGSNGKSTTTNLLSAIMREHGLKVFTNPSGANMPQGIASAMLAETSLTGRMDADIAILEIDEGYGAVIARQLKPQTAVILNLLVDQIYRFGEPDKVAQMFRGIAAEIGSSIVLNRDDNFLGTLGSELEAEGRLAVEYFGVTPEVQASAPHGQVSARDFSGVATTAVRHAVAEVVHADGYDAKIAFAGTVHEVRMPSRGIHYAVDIAAAFTLAARNLGDRFDITKAISAVQTTKTVYGRGEILQVNGVEVEILMLKNLASLQLNLDYLQETPDSVLFAYDESSKDPSWLYAADLSRLDHVDVISGPKGAFVALRLAYEGKDFGVIEPDITKAVQRMLDGPKPKSGRHTFFLDYDQMMATRRYLGYKDLEAGAA
ncbi:Mur ligase family protein [Mycetocola miduiensis]|uniref:Lipid II isoglutaminyl synthase (glutamine-hydrolyzing) subunit MurT n=1 Tax=Mycetocola miduiensis TaxID=995034 RepID=A0A1I5CNT9_9MICO|nr:Mur ligase family protein [Mycetocola miduiensis]SFN88526.1 UDP-N-acetylmuramyl tripeptide synthase [Mycetocola miduiensis]